MTFLDFRCFNEHAFISGGTSGKKKKKKSVCQCRRHQRCGFDPWAGKVPCRRKWQPALVFLPGKFHGERSLADHGVARIGHD